MSIYAILSGNYDSENITDRLNLRKDYFIELLNLETGIPSVDIFLSTQNNSYSRITRFIRYRKFDYNNRCNVVAT